MNKRCFACISCVRLVESVIAIIKESKFKVQAQIQDDQVLVTGKNRDDLQETIQLLKWKDLGVEMQFNNFRE